MTSTANPRRSSDVAMGVRDCLGQLRRASKVTRMCSRVSTMHLNGARGVPRIKGPSRSLHPQAFLREAQIATRVCQAGTACVNQAKRLGLLLNDHFAAAIVTALGANAVQGHRVTALWACNPLSWRQRHVIAMRTGTRMGLAFLRYSHGNLLLALNSVSSTSA
jgi:hypothetical protein